MYILDEPSIGLTQRHRTIDKVLLSLRDLGTVIVVEHDEDIMKAADHRHWPRRVPMVAI
jgi:excinuclease UvrABC ATPase subunit